MPLPKIATPTYELELPSTGETIQYRPFLVKEEKLLVIALESEDNKQITTAIKTVIKNCILTKNIKVESLPTFDIEYLFLNIRGKSVGEELEVNIICPDDNETNVTVNIDLDDIKIQKNEEHTNRIKVDSNSDKPKLQPPACSIFPSESHFMRNHKHSHAFDGETHHGFQDFTNKLGIQSTGRFIKQYYLRLHGEGSGDSHPLLLSS